MTTLPKTTHINSILIIVIILLFINPSLSYTQTTQQYSGSYSINNSLTGKANIEFYLNGKDTIYNGIFNFSAVQNVNENTYKSTSIIGKYKNNEKHDSWQFSHKTITPQTTLFVDDYKLTQKVDGDETIIQSNFYNGNPDGEWIVSNHKIKNSVPTDTSFYARTHFLNGLNVKNLFITTPALKINGKINNKEFLDGVWQINHLTENNSEIIEQRIYDNGVLKQHFFLFGNEKITLYNQENTTENFKEVTVDVHFLNINLLTNLTHYTSEKVADASKEKITEHIKNANSLIQKAYKAFINNNDLAIWDAIRGSKNFNLPKIQLQHFALSKEEKQYLNNIAQLINANQQLLKDFFDDSQIEISRHAHEDLNKYVEIFSIYNYHHQKLTTLKQLANNNSFEYLNREKILPLIYPNIVFPDSISYEFKDSKKTVLHQFPKNLLPKDATLKLIYQHLKNCNEDIKSITQKTEKITLKYKKIAALKDKEEELVEKRDKIIFLFENKNDSALFTTYHQNVAPKVIQYTQQQFKHYSALAIDDKTTKIDTMITCFNNIIQLYHSLSTLPKKIERIDELYTKITWNPFTYTDMEERVKERVYKAYENDLLPFVVQHINSSINCEHIISATNNFNLLYEKMVALREVDTKELEKQLKRTKKIEDIIVLFEIKFNLN